MDIRKPIEVAAEFQAAFTQRDGKAVAAVFAKNATLHVAGSPDVAAIGVRKGREAIRQFFDDLIATVTPVEMELFNLISNDENVVALGHFHYRLNATGREYESDFALHFAVEEGQIQRYQMYEDSYAVAEAFAEGATRAVRGSAGNRIDFLDLDCRTGEKASADPIVLLHGLGCTWQIWNKQISDLSTGRRVIAMNCRGSGASDLGASEMEIGELAGDVHALLAHLGIPRAVVMGLSMGGMVALQHALDYPDEASKLIVVGSSSGAPESLRAVGEQQRRFIAEHEMTEIAESRMLAAFGEKTSPDLRSWAVQMIAGMDLESYRAQADAAFGFDVRDRLKELRIPVHVIHGENDRSLPLMLGKATHGGIAGSKLHVVDRAGHFPNLEDPGSFNSLIASIVDE